MGIKLTKKQKRLLDFISEFIDMNGTSPSYREIAGGLGLKSVASVAEHVDHLVALGALKRNPGSARSLEVVDTTYPETTLLFKSRLLTCSPECAIILRKAADILGIELEAADFPVAETTEEDELAPAESRLVESAPAESASDTNLTTE